MKILLIPSMLLFLGIQLNAQGLVLQRGTTIKTYKPDDLIRLTIPTGIMDTDGRYCNYLQIEGIVKDVKADSMRMAVSSYKKRQLIEENTQVEDWLSSPNMSLASTISIDDILEIEILKSHKHQHYKQAMAVFGFTLLSIGSGSAVASLAIRDRAIKGTLLGIAAGSVFSGITIGLLSVNKSYKLKKTEDPWQIVRY